MLHSRAGYRSAGPIPSFTHIRLATHGRSIQVGHSRPIHSASLSDHVRYDPKATELLRGSELTRSANFRHRS